jgi:PAS domain S-box-containing protein
MLEADSIEQVRGACVFDVVAPEYRDGFRAMHERVCAGHKERFECEIIGLKSATRRRVETHAVPIIDPETGQRIHLGLTRDISYRNGAGESSSRLAAIVESSDDAIVSKDLNGVITSWNKGAERLFGYSAGEVIGRPVTILMPPERVNEEPGILARIRKGERIDHYETIRRRKDGTLVNVSLTVSPIKDVHGHVIGASKIARDITDKVLAKEQLEQTVAERTAQLRDTVAELEAFSYSVAHDMRAPLRSMTSYARFLEDDFAQALPPKGQEFVRRIAASAQRLDGLITDVLNYSKVTRGEIQLERVDVEKLTREIVDSYPDLQESGATILVQSPIPPVIGNIAALTQCVSNLLSNAIKFVPAGIPAQVRVRAEKKSEYVRIWFEDNGIGISEGGQKRIFQMFQRLNPTGEFEGSGIGLTIVRKAVERMGGRIGVESEPGQGSRFWIELKRAA